MAWHHWPNNNGDICMFRNMEDSANKDNMNKLSQLIHYPYYH